MAVLSTAPKVQEGTEHHTLHISVTLMYDMDNDCIVIQNGYPHWMQSIPVGNRPSLMKLRENIKNTVLDIEKANKKYRENAAKKNSATVDFGAIRAGDQIWWADVPIHPVPEDIPMPPNPQINAFDDLVRQLAVNREAQMLRMPPMEQPMEQPPRMVEWRRG